MDTPQLTPKVIDPPVITDNLDKPRELPNGVYTGEQRAAILKAREAKKKAATK